MSILFGVVDSHRVQGISYLLTHNWCPIGAVAPELPENISPFISSFEIQAHFVAGQADRALDLIRRSWGWYLNNPNGTQSTVIEGYLQNATFGYRSSRGYDYDASYISHSHGWSAGPTSTLTNYVLGLSITGRLGSTWKLSPQFGDLTNAEGGFTTSLGKFSAAWQRRSAASTLPYTLTLDVPVGTSGEVVLPVSGSSGDKTQKVAVKLNGNTIKPSESPDGSGLLVTIRDGGKNTFTVG